MVKQLDLFGSHADEQPVKPTLKAEPGKQEQPAIPVANATTEPADQAPSPGTPAFPARHKKENTPVKKGKRGRKSIKEMDAESAMISIPDDETLFKKQYYSIGEVAEMFNLNTSLLRYWETEFDILKPRKNRKGDRHFRPEDIKNLSLIHHLLRQRKYTIEGAKDYLKKNKLKAQQNFGIIQRLEKLKGFLLELKAGL
ncbi:MerR family transcriptional regulator [Agriterribacter sp.]|uniref:MerR family transcriptional regulator n=1 Tax=Agriterribacter sp. TaxID=2821509 RepID=UPI002BBA69B6|nr:MerR family transcriptional regulator [Agriterribacter sp.]HRO44530.1 MerR family transcriptional regulator [Agriterribacter sp.]HRQ16444.1 MerR family transcriptional regulator [Agriterribacter sp.]